MAKDDSARPRGRLAGVPGGEIVALSALYESTRAIGIRPSLDDLLHEVLSQAERLIGFEHAALMLFEEATGTLRVARLRGYGDRSDDLMRSVLSSGEGLSGWAVQHRRSVRVGDVRVDPRYRAGLPEARSNMAVPLIVGRQVAGVINVESERKDAFTEEHEKMLTVLGAQAALAIIAFRTQDDLRARVAQLEALHRVSRLASEAGSLGVTLNQMLEIAQEIVPEAHCAILLLDDETGLLRLAAGQGYQAAARYLEIPVGRGVTGRCAETRQTQLVRDLLEPDAQHYIPGIPGARSELALPMVVEGKTVGVLNAESVEPDAFDEASIQTLKLIAHQAAAVIRGGQLLDETRRLAITDGLTGLHNRRHFMRQLDEAVRRAGRYQETMALIMLDLDLFKDVNDRFGHQVGDRVLELLATALRDSVRESDQAARLGGEEFALLLLRCDRDLAIAIADRVRERIRHLALEGIPESDIDLSASVGIAFFPEDGQDPKTLMRAADDALYAAKRSGRDRVVLAEAVPDIETETVEEPA
ncbi:MAG TPA: sensor domain-containing diguanylate cyclase [Gemmatimonadota bacterium]|nr:sensor domain-containing diguanylate cyclase [Gemmatimonadota bacterium]